MHKTRVYVAGPISIGHVATNLRKGVEVAEELWTMGYAPYSPHATSGFWDFLFPHTNQEWYAFDYPWIDCCDAMYRIPGESIGSDAEVLYMLGKGKPVFTTLESLYKTLPKEMP